MENKVYLRNAKKKKCKKRPVVFVQELKKCQVVYKYTYTSLLSKIKQLGKHMNDFYKDSTKDNSDQKKKTLSYIQVCMYLK